MSALLLALATGMSCAVPAEGADTSTPGLDLAAASGWYLFTRDANDTETAFVTFSLDGRTISTSLGGAEARAPLDGSSFVLTATQVSHSYGSHSATYQRTTTYDGTFVSVDSIEGTTRYDASCDGEGCQEDDTYTETGTFTAEKTSRP